MADLGLDDDDDLIIQQLMNESLVASSPLVTKPTSPGKSLATTSSSSTVPSRSVEALISSALAGDDDVDDAEALLQAVLADESLSRVGNAISAPKPAGPLAQNSNPFAALGPSSAGTAAPAPAPRVPAVFTPSAPPAAFQTGTGLTDRSSDGLDLDDILAEYNSPAPAPATVPAPAAITKPAEAPTSVPKLVVSPPSIAGSVQKAAPVPPTPSVLSVSSKPSTVPAAASVAALTAAADMLAARYNALPAPTPAPLRSQPSSALIDDSAPPSRGHRPPTADDMDLEAILQTYSHGGSGAAGGDGGDTPGVSAADLAVEEALAAAASALPALRAKGAAAAAAAQQVPTARRRGASLSDIINAASLSGGSSLGATTGPSSRPPPGSAAGAGHRQPSPPIGLPLSSTGSQGSPPGFTPRGGAAGATATSSGGSQLAVSPRDGSGSPSTGGDPAVTAIVASSTALRRAAQRESELLAAGNVQIISPLASRRKRHRSGYSAWLAQATGGTAGAGAAGRPSAARRRPDALGTKGSSFRLSGLGPPSRRGSVDSASYVDGDDSASVADTDIGDAASVVAGGLAGGTRQGGLSSANVLAPSAQDRRILLRNGRGLMSTYRPFQQQAAVPDEVATAVLASPELAQALPLPLFVDGDKPRMGIMRVDRLPRLSDQLATFARAHLSASASRAAGAANPGLPTCLAVHQKFIAVGTSRSLLLIYDHFQELKGVLTRVPVPPPPAPSGAGAKDKTAASNALLGAAVTALQAPGASDGAVTAIDVCPTQEYVAVGYFSGRVALFDVSNITKAPCLKVLEGVHKAPITSVRFVSPSEPKLLTVDNGGTVNFVTFSRFMGLRWGVDSRCVLDGSRAGQVVAVSVLHPPSGPDGAAGGGGAGAQGSQPQSGLGGGQSGSSSLSAQPYGTLIGLSTREHTYVLTTLPDVAVVHKWARPADVPPDCLPSLSWARGRVAGTAVWEALEERRAAVELAASFAADAQQQQQQQHGTSRASGGGGLPPSSASATSTAGGGGTATLGGGGGTATLGGGGTATLGGGGTATLGGGDGDAPAGGDEPTPRSRRGSMASSVGGSSLADGSTAADGKRGAAGSALPGTASAQQLLPRQLAAAATAARLRAGSSLPLGTGVVTSANVPVLARAWGHHLQLLQVTPPGGFPPEMTNLATLERTDGGTGPGGAAGPRGGPGAGFAGAIGDKAGRVFGSLASALLTDPASQGTGAGGAAGGASSAASTGRPCDFVLADDCDSQDPLAAVAWLSESTLAYLTGDEALILLDTAEVEETDALGLGGAKVVYAAIKAPQSRARRPQQQPPSGGAGAAPPAASRDEGDDEDAPTGAAGSPAAPTVSASSGTSSSYAPSFVMCDGTLYLLGLDRLLTARVQSWSERVDALVEEGEWLSALALGLDHYDAVTSAHLAAINAAEQRQKWAAIKATALLQMAAAGGATLNVNAAAFVAAAGGAGPGTPSPGQPGAVPAGGGAPGSASGGNPASLYDPARFERMRQIPGPAGPHTSIGEALERLVRDYLRTMLAACPEGWLDELDGSGGPGNGTAGPADDDGYGDILGSAHDDLGLGLGELDDGLATAPPPSVSEALSRIADPRARHAVAELLAIPAAAAAAANGFGSGDPNDSFYSGGGWALPGPTTATAQLLATGDVWGVVAAVVIDFCVATKRTDLLFGELYDAFAAGGHAQPFLDQLEPYIMTRRLSVMPPVVMKAFVEHFRSTGALASVERCLLLLDLSALDLDGAIRTCLRHRLFSALAHVVNRGLRDFSLPVDVLLAVALEGLSPLGVGGDDGVLLGGGGKRRGPSLLLGGGDSSIDDEFASLALEDAGNRSRGSSGNSSALDVIVPLSTIDRRAVAYKLLLYLAYCLTGRSFPHGRRMLPPPPPPPAPAARPGPPGGPAGKPGPDGRVRPGPRGPQAAARPDAMQMLFADGLPPMLPPLLHAPVCTLLAIAADPALASAAAGALPKTSPFHRSNVARRGALGGAAGGGPAGGHTHGVGLHGVGLSALGTSAASAIGWLMGAAPAPGRPGVQQLPPSTSAGGLLGVPSPGTPQLGQQAPPAPGGAGKGSAAARYGGAAAAATAAQPNRRAIAAAAAGMPTQAPMQPPQSAQQQLQTRPPPEEATSQLPPGMSPSSLRGDVLSLLLEDAPQKFPAVSNSLLLAGGLGAGAKTCSLLPGPAPRLQACLRLDAVTTLALLGRLFTSAADALCAGVWVGEGTEGLLRRRACLPGDVPPIPVPEFPPPQQAQAQGAGKEGQAKPPGGAPRPPAGGVSPPAIDVPTGPPLHVVLQAVVTAALALERERLRASRPSLLVRSSGPPGPRKGLPPAAAAASQLGAVTYLFTAFQMARTGPGMPQLVAPHSILVEHAAGSSGGASSSSSETPAPVLPDVLFFLALPPSPVTGGAAGRFGTASRFGGADEANPTFPLSDAAVDSLLRAWAAHSDAELFTEPLAPEDAAAERGGQQPSHAASSGGAGAALSPSLRWTREDLLVRLLRTVPLSRELRGGLYEACHTGGLHRAALVLSAQLGDAGGVIDGFLRCADGDGEQLAGRKAPAASEQAAPLARRVFRFVRSWNTLCTAAANAQAGSSSGGGASTGTASGTSASSSSVSELAYVDGLVPGLLIPGGVQPSAPPSVAAPFLSLPSFDCDPGYEAMLTAAVRAALTGALPLAPDARGASAVYRGSDAPFLRDTASAELRGLHTHLMRVLPRLVAVSQGETAELVTELFPEHTPALVTALEAFPRLHFQYLKRYLVRAGVISQEEGDATDNDNHRGTGSGATASAMRQGGGGMSASGSSLPVTADIHLRYIGLLCQFAPHAVTRYLMAAAAAYPLNATLTLVRDVHKNAEATAYLLERTGDVLGALELMLGNLGDKLGRLGKALASSAAGNLPAARALVDAAAAAEADGAATASSAAGAGMRSQASSLSSVPGGLRTLSPVHASAGADCDAFAAALGGTLALCTRNSNRFNGPATAAGSSGPAGGSSGDNGGMDPPLSSGGAAGGSTGSERLWFALLDLLLERQRDVKAALSSGRFPASGDVALVKGGGRSGGRSLPPLPGPATVAVTPSGATLPPETSSFVASAAGRAVLAVLSDGVRAVLEGMRGSVPLNAMLAKVLADHSRAEFGAFRETITGMLDSYVYEERILATANALMARDIYKAAAKLHSGHALALVPSRAKGGRCCACAALLSQPPPRAALLAGGSGDDDDDGDALGATSAAVNSGLVMVFGCGHAFHGGCLPVDATACQLCSASGAAGQRKGATGDSGARDGQEAGGPSSRNRRANDGDDEDEDDARRVMTELSHVDRHTGAHARVIGSAGATGRTTGLPSGGETGMLGREDDGVDDRDPHAARLHRARESRKRAKPLAELYRELGSAGGITVHRVALRTAPPRVPGSADFKIRRAPVAFRRDVTAACTYAGVDEPVF